ncbi:MAG: iron ABC transporter permease [Armatimonadota bacterium]|nr:iron ABC transporter permease [Armatimonadota bacterium]MDR7548355.1 iron ABC transporter permease [Armatimonadota bacterium]
MTVAAATRRGRPGESVQALADALTMPALTVLMVGALLLFIVYPLGLVFVKSFEGDAGPTLGNYVRFFSSRYFLGSLRNSLVLAAITTAATVTLGLVVAFVVTRGPTALRMPARLTALLPLIAPSYVFGVALIILGGRQGLVNQMLGTEFRIFGWPGVILGQVLTILPVCYLMAENVLTSMDRNLEDSASDLGASALQVVRTITLPLATPGLLKAALLAFALSIADFATPTILGGGLAFLAQDALLLVIGAEYDLRMASVLSVFLILPSFVSFLVHHRWLAGRSYTTITGRGGAVEARAMPPVLQVPLVLLTMVVCLAILIPMAVVVFGAFTQLAGINNAWTLQHFSNFRGLRALAFSLRMAAVAAGIAAVLGVVLAYVLARRRFAGRSLVEFVALLGFAIPGTVLGIGYVLAFNTPPLRLTGTFWIIVLGCVFHYLAVVVEAGISKLSQIDVSLEEASRDMGASTLGTFGRIVLPLMGTALMAGLVYTFMNSMLTLSTVIFLISPGRETASAVIFHFARMGELGLASAFSVLLIGAVLLCLAVLWTVVRRRGMLVLGGTG